MDPTCPRPVRVSVVIAAFNYARYLGRAIDSVLAQGDDGVVVDLTVVDDGSTDATWAVIAGFGDQIRGVRRVHAGTATTLNRGLDVATGPLLAFLDADDEWIAGKLRRQVKALEARPDLDGVFSHAEEFVSPELPTEDAARLAPRAGAVPAPIASTLLIRRRAFDRVGPFREAQQFGEFVEWYGRAADAGIRLDVLPFVGLRRRLHLTNRTRVDRRGRADYVRILKASLDRRRAAPPDDTTPRSGR